MPYEAIDHWSRLHERDDLSSVGQSGLSPAIDSWLYRILERNLRAFVDHHSLRRPPPDSAFEIGAGTGYWVGSWRAAGVARVDGCDLVPADVDRLQARHGTTGSFMVADITDGATLPRSTYDLVTSTNVLLHVIDDDSFERALRPLVERLGAGVAYRGVGVLDDRRSPVAVD